MNIPENAVKVYKDTAWVWVGIIFLVVMLASLAWLWFAYSHDIWGYIWLGVAAVGLLLSIIYAIVRKRNTIVVCPDFLRIEHVQRRTKDYEWEDLGTIDIEWSNIKQFSKETFRWDYYYYIIVEPTKGMEYRFAVMDPTHLFLKRQLRKYHKQFRKSKK